MFRILLFSFALCFPLLADDASLIRVGEDWHYWKATSEPSSPVTAWRQLGFDDSAWLSGPSAVGYPSGAPGIATGLADFGVTYKTLFLRRKFLVADPAAIKWFVLRMDYEHGFVAYLNGVEIARRGLAGLAGRPVPF